jgi:hypothetical protein
VILLLSLPISANAAPGTWQTDAGVGPNEIVFTLDLTCSNPGFVCDLIDGYSDQDTSLITGNGGLQIDDLLDEIQFDQDSVQDVGSGTQPAYLTMAGSDLTFANIAFAGVPEITNLLVFALSNPIISVPGFLLETPGDYPFSQSISYSGLGTVIGNLEFVLGPNIIVPPTDVVVSGTLRVLGDIDFDAKIEYELIDLTGTFGFQNATTIGGESVLINLTADMTANLSGETDDPNPQIIDVPMLGAPGLLVLASALAGFAIQLVRKSPGRSQPHETLSA